MTMAPANIALEATSNLPYPHGVTGEERTQLLKAYRTGEAAIRAQFAVDLANEYGFDNDALDALVFARAWEDGHSYGYQEVERLYSDYVDFLTNAFQARTQ